MIVIIDNYDAFSFSLRELAFEAGNEVHLFRNDGISVDAIKELQPHGIILSSGSGSPQQTGICFDLLNAFSPKIPILGVDLGCHVIAEFFGAKTVTIAPIHAIACMALHFGGSLYQNIASPFVAGQYHSHVIDKRTCPSVLLPEAEKDDGTLMSIKHAEYPCYGVQFHPESMLTPEGPKMIANFCSLCKKQGG